MHQNPSDIPAEPLHRCAPPRRAGAIGEVIAPPRVNGFFVYDSCVAEQPRLECTDQAQNAPRILFLIMHRRLQNA